MLMQHSVTNTSDQVATDSAFLLHQRSNTSDILQRNTSLETCYTQAYQRYPVSTSLHKADDLKKYQRFLRDYEPEWTSHNWNLAFGQPRVIVNNTPRDRRNNNDYSDRLRVQKSTATLQSKQADLLREAQPDPDLLTQPVVPPKRYTTVSSSSSGNLVVTKIHSKRSHKKTVCSLFDYPAGQTVQITSVAQGDAPVAMATPNGVVNPMLTGRYLQIEKIQYSRDHSTPEFGDVAEPELGALKAHSKHSLPSAALRRILQRKSTTNSNSTDSDNTFARIYGTSANDRGRWSDKGWIMQGTIPTLPSSFSLPE